MWDWELFSWLEQAVKRSVIAFAALMVLCLSSEILWWNHGGLVLVSFMSLMFSFNYSFSTGASRFSNSWSCISFCQLVLILGLNDSRPCFYFKKKFTKIPEKSLLNTHSLKIYIWPLLINVDKSDNGLVWDFLKDGSFSLLSIGTHLFSYGRYRGVPSPEWNAVLWNLAAIVCKAKLLSVLCEMKWE